MANIGSRLFNGVADKYVSLANEELVRTLQIGSDWTKLRIGVLLAVTPDGTNNLASAALVLGLCSGTAHPYGAASTTNFIGAAFHASTPGATSGTLTYTANSGNPLFSATGTAPLTRVGTALGSATGSSTALLLTANTGTTQRRSPLYLDITKGSPNYTVGRWSPATSQGQFQNGDCTPGEMLSVLENTAPTWLGLSLTSSSTTIAASEAAGAFDSVDLFWNKAGFPLEVYALAVARLA